MTMTIAVTERGRVMYNYDVTQYTCHDGNYARILIPNSATEDDLRGLYELLQVVAVRRFGVDLTEREGE